MILKNKLFQVALGFGLGALLMLLPRPEGSTFDIVGDPDHLLPARVSDAFDVAPGEGPDLPSYRLVALTPGAPGASGERLLREADQLGLSDVQVRYVDGLSPTAFRFLAVLVVIVFLFVVEPIPLEITAILIGVMLVAAGISDLRSTWATYMHPVVVFIMCCLIFAIAMDRAGLTKRLGHAIARRAGDSVVRFTFLLAIGLGLASSVMHDAAATAIGIAIMMPVMRAAGIEPNTATARFMLISLAFACSCGGMGTLVGGGRCMVSAAFLEELTGIEISFLDWIKYAMPLALATVPAAVAVVYFVFRPDRTLKLPTYDEAPGPWTPLEKKTTAILSAAFILWLTKGMHGVDYSGTGMATVAVLVLAGCLGWRDIHENLEWGTALFIFGGGICLGLAMDSSGTAAYFANALFPLVKGGGWLLLLAAVCVFGALITNAMANVAAAALILPIVIPLAQLEGVDPRLMALGLGTATSFAMLLVIGCPPNAIAYSFKYFRSADLSRAGLAATPILLLILLAVAGVWWSILGLI